MQQTYHELVIIPSAYYELFVDVALSLCDEALEESDGKIILRSESPLEMVAFGIEAFAKELTQALGEPVSVVLDVSEKTNQDWIQSYRQSVEPIHVGDFYIHPSWYEDLPAKHNIIIDPALAFGSGHHETTFGSLLMLQRYVTPNDTLLDVGCGSGILSIAAAKLGARVDACDTDEQAVCSTKENFMRNGTVYETLWEGSVTKRQKSYDVVVANIIADVLLMLHKELQEALKPGGILILSGILEKYINKVEAKYATMILKEKYHQKEWYTLVLQRKED